MAEQLEAEDSTSWERIGKDLVAGAAGGIAQVLLGQPFGMVASHLPTTPPNTESQKSLFPPLLTHPDQPKTDIIKVRLQTTNQYSSALDCGKKILAHEGPLAFYKGTLTPLIGIGACVSVQFGAFHYARRRLEEYNLSKHSSSTTTNPANSSLSSFPSPPTHQRLTYTQYYLSGAFAGVTNSLLSGPIEHVRIRLQTQPHTTGRNHNSRLYNGPLDCIRKLRSRGGLRGGLYRGQAVTVLREAQAYGVWFLTFEYLMDLDIRRNRRSSDSRSIGNDDANDGDGRQWQQGQWQGQGQQHYSRSDISSVMVALYGGLAGEALWISSYPFDVVKSKMQSDGFGFGSAIGSGAGDGPGAAVSQQRYKNMRDCFAQTWRGEGLRGFWKGIGPTLVRAMPVSAGTFAVVELVMRALG